MPRRNRKKKNAGADVQVKKQNGNSTDRGKEDGSSKIAEAAHSVVMDLADFLKAILNSGLVVVGDVKIRIEDVELPIKLRLLITIIKKAKEEGVEINWWENDPFYSVKKQKEQEKEKKESRQKSKPWRKKK